MRKDGRTPVLLSTYGLVGDSVHTNNNLLLMLPKARYCVCPLW